MFAVHWIIAAVHVGVGALLLSRYEVSPVWWLGFVWILLGGVWVWIGFLDKANRARRKIAEAELNKFIRGWFAELDAEAAKLEAQAEKQRKKEEELNERSNR